MAKSSKKNNSIEVVELEVQEDTLDNTIKQELVKHNITDAIIADLKKKYGDLRLRDIDDKEGYLDIKDARKHVRGWGVLTEKICKKGREDAIAIQKKWLSKEKEVLAKIAEVQEPLDAEIKRFEDEIERREQEKIRLQEEAFMQRQSTLLKYGAVYANGCFNLGEIQYESSVVKEADQDIWETSILPKYKAVYERNESIKVEEEKKRFEEAEKLRKDREELESQQKALREQQEALRKQQEEATRQENERLESIRKANAEADRIKREEDQRADDERREKIRQKLQGRQNQLVALGMTFSFQYDAYVFQDVNVDNKTELCLLPDNEWDKLVEKITPVIEQRKQEAEQKKLDQIEKEKQAAIEAAAKSERERIEREQAEIKRKKEEEAARKSAELEAATDKTKWGAWLDELKKIPPMPVMKSSSYKARVAEAQKYIDKIMSL